MSNAEFERFVEVVVAAKLKQAGQAASFIWCAEHREGKDKISMEEICEFFSRARMANPNTTRLDAKMRTAGFVRKDSYGYYQLGRKGLEEGNRLFEKFISKQNGSELVANVRASECPYVTEADIVDAKQMAELHVILFCLENSMRRHIERTLQAHLGQQWWEMAASAPMKKKEQDRRTNEQRNRWVPTRADSGPLYSLDWNDLVTLVRKYENAFKSSIPDINFLHRFQDLGNLRNVVAHNGVISDAMQYRRVELAFHDWTRQIAPTS